MTIVCNRGVIAVGGMDPLTTVAVAPLGAKAAMVKTMAGRGTLARMAFGVVTHSAGMEALAEMGSPPFCALVSVDRLICPNSAEAMAPKDTLA